MITSFSKAFASATTLVVCLLLVGVVTPPPAAAEGPAVVGGQRPVPTTSITIEPPYPIAQPIQFPAQIHPRIPVLDTVARLSGEGHLGQPILFDPPHPRSGSRVTSHVRVFSTGEVEIHERFDRFVCLRTFASDLTIADPPNGGPIGPIFPIGPCTEEEHRFRSVYVTSDRIRELARRLARVGAVRVESQTIYSLFVQLFPQPDDREVTFHRSIGPRKIKDGRFFGRHAITNSFAYRDAIDAYMLIEGEIQRFLRIVDEEGLDAGNIIILDPIDPREIPITHDAP